MSLRQFTVYRTAVPRNGRDSVKRFFCLISCFIIALTVLAGCGEKTEAPTDTAVQTQDSTAPTTVTPTTAVKTTIAETTSAEPETTTEKETATEQTETTSEPEATAPAQETTAEETQPVTQEETEVTESTNPPPEDVHKYDVMVWVSKGSKKFHTDVNCTNTDMKEPRQLCLSDAINQGYNPCSACCKSEH